MTDTHASETSGSDLGELTLVRTYAAPIELLFDCMTQAEHLCHFWGPVGVHTPIDGIVVEPHAGGRFETRMVSDDGSGEFTMKAVFVEIERPTRIVWTEPEVEGGMTSALTFRAIDEGHTEVTTHQTNVPAMYRSPEAQAGMQSSFDKCDAYLETLVASS